MQNLASRIDKSYIPNWAMEAGLPLCFSHVGISMLPTLQSGCVVYVRQFVSEYLPGDVIVFIRPWNNCFITHRIIAVTYDGFVTRGDNNLTSDESVVSVEQIIGKVEMATDSGQIHRIAGGKVGLRKAQLHWIFIWLIYFFRRLFWRPFHFFRLNEFVHRIWKPQIVMVEFQTLNGPLFKYIYKNRTVGFWNPVDQKFVCRKPFDLVISSPLAKHTQVLSPTHAKLD